MQGPSRAYPDVDIWGEGRGVVSKNTLSLHRSSTPFQSTSYFFVA